MERKLPFKAEDTNVSNVERKTPVMHPILEKAQGDPLLDATRMNETAVHKIVREAYASRVTNKNCGTSCCQKVLPSANIERAAEKMGYTKKDANEPGNLGLGCGAPLKAAAIKEGDTVLDLGSGAGFDAFLAARIVGPSGRVIGVDLTPEMVEKAMANAKKHDRKNVDFRLGKIEALPVDSDSVDCVISNCVINLSPDKPEVFREAHRVLKPGGRVAFSDICLTRPLPASVRKNMAAYVGCIAGASVLDEYMDAMRAAGFLGVEASIRRAFDVLACDDPIVRAALAGVEEDDNVDVESLKDTIVSATAVAYKG
jgi:SAM-dependent methyltransferase